MLYKLINLVFFALMVLANYLANALPINGKTTGQLSAQYPNLFVPAGITFSIWGVIYFMLLIFIVVQFLGNNKIVIQQIGWLFAITCVLNALWIIAWHYEWVTLSVIIMLGLLAALVLINLSLKGIPNGIIKASFGVYLGWICIATIANITAWLVHIDWGAWGMSHQFWTITMIAIGAIITIMAISQLNNPFIGLAVIWAFIGILLKRHTDFQTIAIAAVIGAVLLAAVTVFLFLKGTERVI